jgi:hypothetical protein
MAHDAHRGARRAGAREPRDTRIRSGCICDFTRAAGVDVGSRSWWRAAHGTRIALVVVMPIPRLISSAAIVAVLFATGCPDEPAPEPMERCPAGDADLPALEAWLARPLKTCSLEAIFPHRASYAWADDDEAVTGWDRDMVLAGADDNGFISFGDDGRSFAVLRDFAAPGGRSYERVLEPLGACADSDAPAFTATVALADGVCTVRVGDDVAYAGPLYDTVNVALASWPGMTRQRWDPPRGSTSRPPLSDGYEYVDAPSMAAFYAYTLAPDRFTVLAEWLGVDAAAARAHVAFDPVVSWNLATAALGDGAPYVWLIGGTNVATHDEARLLAARPLPWTVHTNAGTSQDSVFEVGGELRYLGTRPRDTAEAAKDGAACVRALLERDLAAHAASRYRSPARSDYTTCDALTVDLAAAVVADAETLGLAMALYSDAARERYGVHHDDRPTGYEIGSLFVQEVVATAMAAGVDAGDAPSLMLSHALASWHVLAEVVAAHPDLAREIAAATLERAETDVILLAQGLAGRAPLLASDAAQVGTALVAAAGDRDAVRRVLQAIAYDEAPGSSPL